MTKLALEYPVQWGEDCLIAELEFRRLTAADIKDLDDSPKLSDLLKAASKACVNKENLTPAFFMKLDAADAMAVGECMGDFLQRGQRTGPST